MRIALDAIKYVQEIQSGNHTNCNVEPGASKAQVGASTVTHFWYTRASTGAYTISGSIRIDDDAHSKM